jgi:hypothetical protein
MGNGQSITPKVPAAPRCPGCQAQPLNFAHQIYPLATGALVCIISCVDCGHVLGAQQVGQKQPLVAPGVMPHELPRHN